jgi:hypothetical protein
MGKKEKLLLKQFNKYVRANRKLSKTQAAYDAAVQRDLPYEEQMDLYRLASDAAVKTNRAYNRLYL